MELDVSNNSNDNNSTTTNVNARSTSGSAEVWETDHPEYPRKLMQRKRWLSLDGAWRFTFDDEGKAKKPSDIKKWNQEIRVPYAPESKLSGVGDQGFHTSCWYERDVEFKRNGNSRTFLHFGAVDYQAQVWVNHCFVGQHEGGHTPFSLDITDVLAEDGKQTISVWVLDAPHDPAKPRGKQDWQLNPHSIWYPRTTGIWQTVWLEEVPHNYVERIIWSPHLERWEIGLEAFIKFDTVCFKKQWHLRVRLSVGEGENRKLLADDRYEIVCGEVHRRIALSDPGIDDFRNELLWSPEKPTLIDAHIELQHDGETVDEIRSYTALRGVACQRGRFLLNNRPYYLRLILDQGYWEESMMTPPSEEAIIKDIELVKAAGFNGVRKHQKIEDPRYLYWADKLGLMVWEEMPSAYRFTHESVQRIIKEWTEVINRDFNHPCIITWVPFNESWGVPDLPEKEAHRSCVQALYHLTKTLDPSRPVVGNDGWEAVATDILGIHDYDDDPMRILKRYGETTDLPDVLTRGRPGGRLITLEGHPHRGQPIMITEFGGIAHRDPRYHANTHTWGYSVSRTSEDFQYRYSRLLDSINRLDSITGFCYTQFADTFQEANGLFFADRTPKIPLEILREATLGRGHARIETPPPIIREEPHAGH